MTQGYAAGRPLFNATATVEVKKLGVNIATFDVASLKINAAGQLQSSTSLRASKGRNCTTTISDGDIIDEVSALNRIISTGINGTNIIFGGALPSSFAPGVGFPCQYNSFALTLQSPTPEYDNAPGGYRQDLVQIKNLLNGAISGFVTPELASRINIDFHGLPGLINKKQAFIPVLSAFGLNQDMDNTNMFQNFQANRIQLITTKITPFDEIFAPSSNLKHVEVNQEMITWLMGKIQLQGSSVPSSLISQSYNFANQSVNEIPQVSIGMGATVKINGSGGAGLGNEPNDAPNPFTVSTSLSCGNSTIEVGRTTTVGQANNGFFQIGEGTRVGVLQIRDKGIMTIRQNGTLTVEPNSQIIIENGGKLIIDNGANINLVGSESTIYIKSGGELVINGNMNFSGNGFFQFDAGHVLTLSADLVLRGSGKTNTLIKLTDAPPGTENKLVINGRSVNISEAKISYGVNSQIEITSNSSEQTHVFNGVTFTSTSAVNGKALNLKNTGRVTITNCDFDNLIEGVSINGNSTTSSFISISNSNFSSVNSISIADFIAHPQGCPSTTIANCNFSYNASLASFIGTACKFENLACGISFYGSQFTGYRQGNVWSNFTAIELVGARMQSYYGLKISDFKIGINAQIGAVNHISLLNGSEISNCQMGIIFNGGSGNTTSGVQIQCAKIVNNMTGIKGTNVRFGGEEGKDVGMGNEFRHLSDPNSLLFDLFYPVGPTGAINSGNINVSNNYWPDGFSNARFNIFTGQCPICTATNIRRSLEQCSELSAICTQTGTPNCCGQTLTTSDGLTLGSYVKQCFAGNDGTSTDALMMRKPTNQKALQADSDKLKVYPNPANETVNVEMESGNYHLRVLNTVGQTIFAQNTDLSRDNREGSLSINVATWTNGIYLFELTDKATNKRQRSKVVVQH